RWPRWRLCLIRQRPSKGVTSPNRPDKPSRACHENAQVPRRPAAATSNLPRVQRLLLLGKDHTELGDVAVDSLGPMAAALTRGRHPKAYPYLDPNEDALVLASDGDLHLMAVADGHN